MVSINDRLNKLGGIVAPEKDETIEAFRARIKRMRVHKLDEKRGRFKVGERVQWRTRSGGPLHLGTVIEVVPRGLYPGREHTTLVLHGYYRETETYVVQCGERAYWPRVGNLERIEP
jgi:hypothetical protein